MNMQWYASLVAIFALTLFVGCGPQADDAPDTPEDTPADDTTAAADGATILCGGCGQVKGSATCCAEDAATCDGCGLAKGSPGCCAITKGTNATLCKGCGQVKGTDTCCAEDATKCEKCGLAKDSPGCKTACIIAAAN